MAGGIEEEVSSAIEVGGAHLLVFADFVSWNERKKRRKKVGEKGIKNGLRGGFAGSLIDDMIFIGCFVG